MSLCSPSASSSWGDPLDARWQQTPRHVSRGGGQSAGGVWLGAFQLCARGLSKSGFLFFFVKVLKCFSTSSGSGFIPWFVQYVTLYLFLYIKFMTLYSMLLYLLSLNLSKSVLYSVTPYKYLNLDYLWICLCLWTADPKARRVLHISIADYFLVTVYSKCFSQINRNSKLKNNE